MGQVFRDNTDLQIAELASRNREISLSQTMKEQEFRQRYALEQQQMRAQQAQQEQENSLKQQMFEFQKEQALNEQPPFSLTKELYGQIQRGNASPEVLKGLGMYVEPKEVPAITPYQRESLDLEREKASYALPRQELAQKKQDLYGTSKLREEFLNKAEVKDYITSKTQVDSMDSMLANLSQGNNKVALDQGLISMFNKLTDPTSVVRESEYARTPENLPVVNRMVGAIDKLKQGGAGLTNGDREALVVGAKIIMDERGRTYNKTLGEYNTLAEQYGFDQSLINRGMPQHTSYFGNVDKPNTMNQNNNVTVEWID